jgi:hypothetical protein
MYNIHDNNNNNNKNNQTRPQKMNVQRTLQSPISVDISKQQIVSI